MSANLNISTYMVSCSSVLLFHGTTLLMISYALDSIESTMIALIFFVFTGSSALRPCIREKKNKIRDPAPNTRQSNAAASMT